MDAKTLPISFCPLNEVPLIWSLGTPNQEEEIR